MDFFFAILPVSVVWNLKLNLSKKIGLGLLLGCGIVTGIISAFKTSQLSSLSERSDLTWETFELYIWNAVEVTLIIVLGSLPPLRVLYTNVKSRRNTTNGTGRSAKGYGDYRLSSMSRSAKIYSKVDPETSYPLVSVNAPETIHKNTGHQNLGKGEVHITTTLETSWSASSTSARKNNSQV